MTTDDLKRLRELERSASPAPWESLVRDSQCNYVPNSVRAVGPAHPSVLSESTEKALADAMFIAALRNAAPALLDAAEECERLRQANADLEQQRAEWIAYIDAAKAEIPGIVSGEPLPDAIRRLRQRVQELEEAIRPFARLANEYTAEHQDDLPSIGCTPSVPVTVGDLRRARQVLEG